MSLGSGTFALGTRRAGRGLAPFRSPLTAVLAAFSLVVQLFAAAPPGLSAPAFAQADEAASAAELEAVFGDAAELCAHIDDSRAPLNHAPSSHCRECPLCRFAAQAVAFVPPDPPVLPRRLDKNALAVRASPGRDALPPYPAQPNPARAPPLAV